MASNPFLNAFGQSDSFGKMIFVALLFVSICGWSLLVYKIKLTRQKERELRKLRTDFAQSSDQPLNLGAKLPLYKIFRNRAIEILNKNASVANSAFLSPADVELLESHLERQTTAEARSLEQNLFVLPTAVSLAPFLGLLGTVWGILIALGELQEHGMAMGSGEVLSGISMALATTVLGLLVAIPPLIGYNYLRAKIREIKVEMNDFASTAVGTLEMLYRKVDLH